MYIWILNYLSNKSPIFCDAFFSSTVYISLIRTLFLYRLLINGNNQLHTKNVLIEVFHFLTANCLKYLAFFFKPFILDFVV